MESFGHPEVDREAPSGRLEAVAERKQTALVHFLLGFLSFSLNTQVSVGFHYSCQDESDGSASRYDLRSSSFRNSYCLRGYIGQKIDARNDLGAKSGIKHLESLWGGSQTSNT